jgi:glycerol-3-phosphate cytidylyltransferase
VIPECSWDQKLEDIKKYSVDVLGMGDDWKGRFDSYRDQCEVVYLERTWGISSSSVRNGIGGEHASELLLLRQAADTILRITRSLGV